MIRQPVVKIREIGRATQGVRLIRIDENDSIASVTRVMEKVDTELDEEQDESVDSSEE